jgi:hypothetical protein
MAELKNYIFKNCYLEYAHLTLTSNAIMNSSALGVKLISPGARSN